MYTAEVGSGTKYAITARAERCGNDITAMITGGTLSHVGAVSLAVYEPERDSATVSTVTAYTHRDDAVSAYAAKKIASALKCTAAVSAGIHIDSADAGELEILRKNAAESVGKLIELLSL